MIVRMRFHEPTIAHVARRTAEGKSKEEIIRPNRIRVRIGDCRRVRVILVVEQSHYAEMLVAGKVGRRWQFVRGKVECCNPGKADTDIVERHEAERLQMGGIDVCSRSEVLCFSVTH